MKKKLAIIGVVVLVLITGVFLFRSRFQRLSSDTDIVRVTATKEGDVIEYFSPIDAKINGTVSVEEVRKILLSTKNISSNDLSAADPEVPIMLLDKRDGSLIIFAELESLSGTGGSRIEIISNKGDFVYDFFGSKFVLLDSFKIQGRKISFNELTDARVCCSMSEDVWINLDKPYKIIKPGFPDSLATYVNRHKLTSDAKELSDSVDNYRLEGSDILLVDRKPYTSIDDSLPKETWQYNLKTRTYKLIK